MSNEVKVKIGLAFCLIILIIVLGLKFMKPSQHDDSIQDETIAKPSKGTIQERNDELLKGIDIVESLTKGIRQLTDEKSASINDKNCQGYLDDADRDGVYDKPILGVNFRISNPEVKVHYNFCSFEYNTQETISLIVTTQKLLNDYVEENEFGDRFVPAFLYKEMKGRDGKFFTDEKIGLVDVQDIILDSRE